MALSLASIRDLLRSREEIFQDALEGRQFNAVYFAMLVFACLVALLGVIDVVSGMAASSSNASPEQGAAAR